jgi:hypothetical protein
MPAADPVADPAADPPDRDGGTGAAAGPVNAADAAEAAHDAMREGLKRTGVALKRAGVPFALAGGYAGWARGAPEPAHDVDFLVAPDAADAAARSLAEQGLDVRQPAEDWLFKVHTDGVVVDVIPRTNGASLDDVLASASEEAVLSVRMPVITATHVVNEKLLALDEHYCDVALLLPTLRALREQVDWSVVRRHAAGHPFAEAVLFLLERLDVVAAAGG